MVLIKSVQKGELIFDRTENELSMVSKVRRIRAKKIIFSNQSNPTNGLNLDDRSSVHDQEHDVEVTKQLSILITAGITKIETRNTEN